MDKTDIELAIAAAAAGAAVVRERYGMPLTRYAKSGSDFATEVDIETEQVIKSMIGAARPDDAILGEESGIHGPAGAARTWMVDPLCGTLNYAAQTPLASINVALRVDGRVVAAAVADPLAGEIFWTDTSRGFMRRSNTDTPMQPEAGARLVDVNLDAPRPNSDWFDAVRLLASARFRAAFAPRVVSTSLACTWVAAGRRAGYVTDGDLSESVHFAAAITLCQATGCSVTDLRGEPVHSGVGGLIAAADPQTHGALVDSVAEARP